MKVFVNDREIDLAPGMTVRHALIGAGVLPEIEAGDCVFDEWNNELGLDGALNDSARIYVKKEEPL
jgi:hypothetical protein